MKFIELLKTDVPMFIFIEKEHEHIVWEHREKYNTEVRNKEVSEFKKEFPFYDKIQEIRKNEEWLNQVQDTVQGISITDLINKHDLDIIDLLIIDIEGAEKYLFPEVLDICPKLQWIQIETHNLSLFCECYLELEKRFNCTRLDIDNTWIKPNDNSKTHIVTDKSRFKT